MSSARSQPILLGRQMVGQPRRAPELDGFIAIRVRELPAQRWAVERYEGPGDKWYPLLFTSSRERALEDAHLRRSKDQMVLLVCAECAGGIGFDSYMTCETCGETGYPRPKAESESRSAWRNPYVIAVIAAALALFFPLAYLIASIVTARAQ